MNLKPFRHEDERRILTEYNGEMTFKRAKIIEVKHKSLLGNHYHDKTDSIFYLLQGKGNYKVKRANNSNSPVRRDWMFPGDCIFVPKGMIHTFELYPNTILLELASEPYDKEDEIPATI